MAINQANLATFESHLVDAYKELFANDPEYVYAAARTTPAGLAGKMAAGLVTGQQIKTGKELSGHARPLALSIHTRRFGII
jgi:hypothetical protein